MFNTKKHTNMNNAQRFLLTTAATAAVVIAAFAFAVHNTDPAPRSTGPCWTVNNPDPAINAALLQDYLHTLQTDPALTR